MKTLMFLVFNTLFVINIMASGVECDSTVGIEAMSLVSRYHQEGCSQDVVSRIAQQYKDKIGLTEFSLPFTSFDCIPVKSRNDYASIVLHPNLHYADNITISMKSESGGCLAFLDVSSLIIAAGKPASTQDVRELFWKI